jgi:hypothetical protein
MTVKYGTAITALLHFFNFCLNVKLDIVSHVHLNPSFLANHISLLTTDVVSSIPVQERCSRYNIMP